MCPLPLAPTRTVPDGETVWATVLALAMSEAIYCGLPVVASDRVGSIGPTDDVIPGVNGWSYPCGDVAALAGLLAELMKNPMQLEKAGKASLENAARHHPSAIASIIADTVVSLVDNYRAFQ